jgi:hypothetical protein
MIATMMVRRGNIVREANPSPHRRARFSPDISVLGLSAFRSLLEMWALRSIREESMRSLSILLALLFILAPVQAQEPDKAGSAEPVSFESKQYQVKISGPAGWTQAWTGPKSSGNWVDLVRFEEPRTQAKVTLSTSATVHRSAKEMIEALKKQFDKDARLAILRKEELGATSKRSKGILFEYTARGKEGPVHAVAAYYHHLTRRYRVYATVRDAGWRVVSDDIEQFAKSIALTSRAFREEKERRNYTDNAQGFALYYPEAWKIRVPARGARVVFDSTIGMEIRVYVDSTQDSLVESVDSLVSELKSRDAADVKRSRPELHPQGFKTVDLKYSLKSKSLTFLYREMVTVHRDRVYRLALVGTEKAFERGAETYQRMVDSFTLTK